MKKISVQITALLAMSVLSACSSSGDEFMLEKQCVPLRFTVGITSSGAETRSGISAADFSDLEDPEIGIFAYTSATHSAFYGGSAGNNCYVRNAAGLWHESEASQLIVLSEDNAYLYSYYPYSAEGTNPVAVPVTVKADQGTGQSDGTIDSGTPDVMYGSVLVVNKNLENATINLKHALAQVAVRFDRDQSDWTAYFGQGVIDKLQLTDGGGNALCVGDGTLNVFTGSVTPGTGRTVTVQPVTQPVVGSADPSELPTVLVYPSANTGLITFSVHLDGKDYALALPAPASGFKAAHRYVYGITVSRVYEPDKVTPSEISTAELTPSSISITDWQTDQMENLEIIVPSK